MSSELLDYRRLLSATLAILAIFVLVAPFEAGAATKNDCNARADANECKQEVDNKCSGKSADEKSKCISGVLKGYVFSGIGGQSATNCGTGTSNAFDPGSSPNCLANLPKVEDNRDQIRNILGVVFGAAAGVSLISLGVAAFNFATAATDAEKISRSKKAIVFSLIGLVITLSAEAIVLTVVGNI